MLKVCRDNKLISDKQLREKCSISDSPLPLQNLTIKGYLTHKSELFRGLSLFNFIGSTSLVVLGTTHLHNFGMETSSVCMI